MQQTAVEGDEAEYHLAQNWLDASLFSSPATAISDAMQSGH